MGDPSPRYARRAEPQQVLRECPLTPLRLPSHAAAAACRCGQRRRAGIRQKRPHGQAPGADDGVGRDDRRGVVLPSRTPGGAALARAMPVAVTELRFAHPRSRSPVKSRQGARLRRAGAAWVAAEFAGRRRRFGRKREGGSYIPRSTSGGSGSAAFSCSNSRPEPPAPPGSRSSSRSGLPDSCPARSRPALPLPRLPRRAARRILARSVARSVRGRDPSRQRRVSRDRRPARGRTRSRGLVGRSRRVACEPSPPARLWSWSRSRFRSRTAHRPRSSRCPGARSPACRSFSPASAGAPCDS